MPDTPASSPSPPLLNRIFSAFSRSSSSANKEVDAEEEVEEFVEVLDKEGVLRKLNDIN